VSAIDVFWLIVQNKTPLFVAILRDIFNFSMTPRARTYAAIRRSVPEFYVTQNYKLKIQKNEFLSTVSTAALK
jgi:hypothetical protein